MDRVWNFYSFKMCEAPVEHLIRQDFRCQSGLLGKKLQILIDF